GGLGRQGVLAGRLAPPGAAVAIRPGAACRTGVGLRLPQDRFPVVGDGGRCALRRPDARRSLPQGTRGSAGGPGHRGVSARLRRGPPVAPGAGRPVGAAVVTRDVAPAIVSGDEAHPIRGPWRFRTGDDPRYGTREFDEETWETIAVPKPWEETRHPDYDGL